MQYLVKIVIDGAWEMPDSPSAPWHRTVEIMVEREGGPIEVEMAAVDGVGLEAYWSLKETLQVHGYAFPDGRGYLVSSIWVHTEWQELADDI